jgi:hypothetical protein
MATTKENGLAPELVLADAADRFVRYAVAGLSVQGDLADADPARVLLKAVLRWFGIDAEREVETVLDDVATDLEDVKKGGHRGSP